MKYLACIAFPFTCVAAWAVFCFLRCLAAQGSPFDYIAYGLGAYVTIHIAAALSNLGMPKRKTWR